ncbi:hypothetical protein [Mycolicibacterium llatzerense]|uniref:hypothetical protein n=1 Tax=Mycolicibacterium llatzerense TaxID=280871 RepID=UPI0021B56F4A|nr:hypothetical protein [Mycolicibacterium llatzerense]MCT7369464.1 hypothetical protein [Mycolicibacterium llatzerense]
MRGERDWDQFLNYCTTVAQIDGSQLRAAQLTDERFDKQLAEAIDNAPTSPRPPLVGETAELRELRGVRNDIRALLRTKGMQVSFLQGPEMPSDRLQRRRKREVFDFFRNLIPKKERGD